MVGMAIKISTSGIRGRFDELSPTRIARFTQAFASYLDGGTIAICSDLRPSGVFIREAVIAAVSSCGARVVDFGSLPTPILQWIIPHAHFRGGIAITANHNTFEWNSLIFLNREGAYLSPQEGEEMFNLYHSGQFSFRSYAQTGPALTGDPRWLDRYFQTLFIPDQEERPLRFMIDCGNGFGAEIARRLEKPLKIRLGPIFTGDLGSWQKDPEPNPENASVLSALVRESGSDGGFMVNSDASRLLIVDEKGRIFSEEMTWPILASILLEDQRNDLVTSYATARLIEKVAKTAGVKVFRTDIGQPDIVQMTRELHTTLGGEGNGSFVYIPHSRGFDAFFGIRSIIGRLRKKGVPLSSLAEEWEPPCIIKAILPLPQASIYAVLDRIQADYPQRINLKDGFYCCKGDQWLCVRASSTLALIRLIGEGSDIQDEIDRIRAKWQ